MKKLTSVLVLFLVVSVSHAQTDVGGVIDTDTTWALADSPFTVTSSVLVNAGVTLTIEAGVTVNINDNLGFLINGTLIAQGTAGQKITFQSSSGTTPGSWVSISFGDTSTDASFDGDGNYTASESRALWISIPSMPLKPISAMRRSTMSSRATKIGVPRPA